MIAVSDTSPINYLVLIDCIHVLPALFSRIVVPQTVFEELGSPSAPERIHHWLVNPPGWFGVQTFQGTDPVLKHLDSGERDAIERASLTDGWKPIGSSSTNNWTSLRSQTRHSKRSLEAENSVRKKRH